MNSAYSVNIMNLCESRHIVWKQTYNWFVIGFFMLVAIGVGWHIRNEAKRDFENRKTVAVYTEFMVLSKSVVILLDAKGKILKSNTEADAMFAQGQNIEGRNVHDFCLEPKSIARGMEGMEQWYRSSKPGTNKIIYTTARLPTGEQDIVIVATVVPPTPGNETAIAARINYLSQTTFSDLRLTTLQAKEQGK